MLGLGVPAPPPSAPPMPTRAYRRNDSDQASLDTSDLTMRYTRDAVRMARVGQLQRLGDVYEQMEAHPDVKGPRGQLIAGVQSVEHDVAPAPCKPEELELATEIAARCRDRWFAASPSRAEAIAGITHAWARGTGLTEVIWENRNGERIWTGFDPVPMQRNRFNRRTGEHEFATDSWRPDGTPVAAHDRGTFLAVSVDRHLRDYSLRGVDHAALKHWFPLKEVGSWWPLDIQHYGTPILHGTHKANAEDDRKSLEEAFESLGTGGRLITTDGAKVQSIPKNDGTSRHLEFEVRRGQGITIVYLGATQTVTVEAGAGSKQTSGDHWKVRLEILRTIWGVVSEVIDRDLFYAWTVMNWGLEYGHLAPHLVPSFPKPLDVVQILTAIQKQKELGIPPSIDDAYEMIGQRKPGPNELVIGDDWRGTGVPEPVASERTPIKNGPQNDPASGPRGIVAGAAA